MPRLGDQANRVRPGGAYYRLDSTTCTPGAKGRPDSWCGRWCRNRSNRGRELQETLGKEQRSARLVEGCSAPCDAMIRFGRSSMRINNGLSRTRRSTAEPIELGPCR